MLTIYLADLVYDTIKTNYAVPLNIAYLAASIEKEYAGKVDIHLFKYAKALEKSIQENTGRQRHKNNHKKRTGYTNIRRNAFHR